MINMYSVLLTALVEEFSLEVAFKATDYEKIRLTVEDVARPGLQLAGYFDHFEPMRLQVMGNAEASFMQKLSPDERAITYDRLLSYKFPALLIARNIPVDPLCVEMARKHNVTLLRCKEATSTIVSAIIAYLKAALAPRITRHGVLVEVYGEGILILGDSGVGKSETAIELVKRGHRLIADDAVEIKRVSSTTLVGSAPEIIRHYVELRGIGIVDVRRIFGMGAVKETEKIDMIINLEPWVQGKMYDRLGLDQETTDIMGIAVPTTTIPVKPGRNLAIIMEIAAMNNRQKKMGYNTAEEFNKRLMAQMGVEE